MIEGLWSVEFSSNTGDFGAGIVVFETNRVFGGDSQYYYLGTYVVQNGIIEGSVKVTHFANEPYSIFGEEKEFYLSIKGKISNQVFETQGYRVDKPDLRIGVRFTKQAELP